MSEKNQPQQPSNQLDEDAIAFAQGIFDLARNGGTEMLAPLLDAGVPADIRTSSGDSLLMLASYNGHLETSRLLLEKGADPNLPNDRLQTPLAGVVYKGEMDIVNLLLEKGADVDSRPEGAKTPLMYAAMFNKTDMIERLIDAGADPQAVDADGNSAMTLAKAMGAEEAIALLESH